MAMHGLGFSRLGDACAGRAVLRLAKRAGARHDVDSDCNIDIASIAIHPGIGNFSSNLSSVTGYSRTRTPVAL